MLHHPFTRKINFLLYTSHRISASIAQLVRAQVWLTLGDEFESHPALEAEGGRYARIESCFLGQFFAKKNKNFADQHVIHFYFKIIDRKAKTKFIFIAINLDKL